MRLEPRPSSPDSPLSPAFCGALLSGKPSRSRHRGGQCRGHRRIELSGCSVNHPKLYDPAATASIKAAFYEIWKDAASARRLAHRALRRRTKGRNHPTFGGTRCRRHDQPRGAEGSSAREFAATLESHVAGSLCSSSEPNRYSTVGSTASRYRTCVYSQNGAIPTEALSSCAHTNGGSNETPCTRFNVYCSSP